MNPAAVPSRNRTAALVTLVALGATVAMLIVAFRAVTGFTYYVVEAIALTLVWVGALLSFRMAKSG